MSSAVRDHSIDLIPEYTGSLLQYFDSETDVTTPNDIGKGQGHTVYDSRAADGTHDEETPVYSVLL